MSVRVCVLASGSSGNCTYVASDHTSILVDAGLSSKETVRRLGQIGADVSGIHAVCVSHEHGDHTAGLRVLHRQHGIPLYANSGTLEALRRDPKMSELAWQVFTTGAPFAVGDFSVEAFSVPHDAYEPVGFVLKSGEARVGIVTDMGVPTTLIRERLRRCQVIIVEANHDERLLQDAARPWHLKQRILGRQGHLSNEAAAAMVAEIAGPDLQQVFLAHLSEDCNRQDLALQATERSLKKAGHTHVKVNLTYPDRISEVWPR
ncbi:MAG: MBL fold metallo-hydrolase [Verrucomicrobiota bacterium]